MHAFAAAGASFSVNPIKIIPGRFQFMGRTIVQTDQRAIDLVE
jgi:hypothetical protein